MRAILIDPFQQTVTDVDYSGDYKQIYQLIEADLFTCVTFNQAGDAVFIDDEGLFKDSDEQRYFVLTDDNGNSQLLAGRGLVLGLDASGESISPTVTLEQVQAKVYWPEHEWAAAEAERLLGLSGQVFPFI